MEESVEAAAKTVALAETDLLTSITHRDPTYKGLDEQLAKFRDACVNFIFLDWQAAISKTTETRLWDGHVRVNSKFRLLLAKFREGDDSKKHVERRKAEKLYLDFIKSSMRFYRGFIQRLASHFKDVPEVFAIARKFSLDTLSANAPVSVDTDVKRMILRSCYATLIRLGDLSRYRETELNLKERNWGPAKGYYDLATALDPTDGQSWNQLAVISLADNEHLRAVYYLCRSLSTQKPPSLTRGNLDVELKKVLRVHERGAPLVPADSNGIPAKLVSSFLCYHASCNSELPFPDLEEQKQRKVLVASLGSSLKENAFDSAYRKMCLINMATSQQAEMQARDFAQADPEKAHRFKMVYRRTQTLNVGFFTSLLELFAEDLRCRETSSLTTSPLLRGLLPLLRLYSCWLLSNTSYLLETPDTIQHKWALATLWTVYTESLTLLVAKFPVLQLPDIPYLLDEDEDTISFTPFTETSRELHFQGPAGLLKPSRVDCGLSAPLSADHEMLSRVKGLVVVGAHLYQHKHEFGDVPVPMVFAGKTFHYVPDDAPSSKEPNNLRQDAHTSHAEVAEPRSVEPAPSAMEKMVTNLVDSTAEPSRRSPASQPQSPSARPSTRQTTSRPVSSTYTVSDLVRQMHQPSPVSAHHIDGQPVHHTSFPSVYQNPFTPRPGETIGSAPNSRPGTAHQPIHPSTAPIPPSRGAVDFEQQISHMQHNIQARTSPITPFDPSHSSFYDTPTGLNTFVRNQSDESPWDCSMATPSLSTTGISIPRNSPQPSPFGAIGDPRPRSAKTPTSGQPG